MELELNKPYKAKEIAAYFEVSYDTFRHSRKKYEDELTRCYDWEYKKAKYIFYKKKAEHYKKKSEYYLNEVYLPKVKKAIEKEPWNTGIRVTMTIWDKETIEQVNHVMTTACNYVNTVLRNNYDITGKKYAACIGRGQYPRIMKEEEVKEWREVKKRYSIEASEAISDLTEQKMNGMISKQEYDDAIKQYASSGFANALFAWINEKGYIPVMLKHYEPKGIEFKDRKEKEKITIPKNEDFNWEDKS